MPGQTQTPKKTAVPNRKGSEKKQVNMTTVRFHVEDYKGNFMFTIIPNIYKPSKELLRLAKVLQSNLEDYNVKVVVTDETTRFMSVRDFSQECL
jgi:hypothetical protein